MIVVAIFAFVLWLPLALICWLLKCALSILGEARDFWEAVLDRVNDDIQGS